jgi:hypothetical protein
MADYSIASWLFLKALALIYLIAFASLARQIVGLAGPDGIVPARELLQKQKQATSSWWRRFVRWPTLCWWRSDAWFLRGLCLIGVVLASLLLIGVMPIALLAALWVVYLSLLWACPLFLSYQWDALLLEMGFLAIFLAPWTLWQGGPAEAAAPSAVAWALMVWLLFRLVFSSGWVKWHAASDTWRRLAAMDYHYWTQPLPTPLAWYAHQLPRPWHRFETSAVLVIETLVPFFLFLPEPGPKMAAVCFIMLMVLIQLTGNYGFFNLQTIALTLLVLDNQTWVMGLQPLGLLDATDVSATAGGWPEWSVAAPAGVLVGLSVMQLVNTCWPSVVWPKWAQRFRQALAPFNLVGRYGLFAHMTTQRREIVVEGSQDGEHWHAYGFRYKPGEVTQRPKWAAPHQPRLDWQMWFAALSHYQANPWFIRFLQRLMTGEDAVTDLLQHNPFPDQPPRYVRAVLYDYRFSDRETSQTTGQWWQAERLGMYCPPISLSASPRVAVG